MDSHGGLAKKSNNKTTVTASGGMDGSESIRGWMLEITITDECAVRSRGMRFGPPTLPRKRARQEAL